MLRIFVTDTNCDSSPDMEVSHDEDDNSEDNTHTQDAYRCFIEQDEDDYYMQEDGLKDQYGPKKVFHFLLKIWLLGQY